MASADDMHLDDDRLVSARLGQVSLRRAERTHLAHCAACAARDREWRDVLDRTRATANAAADEAFTPDRLARQRDAILNRLARLAPARVLPFPAAAPVAAGRGTGLGTRWIAAAAAAGLLVGVVTGQYVNFVPHRPARPVVAADVPSRSARASVPVRAVASVAEDDFLDQVDSAILSPRVPELEAIDDLTPRVRDAVILIR